MGDRTYYRLALPAGLDREAARVAAAAFTDDPWTEADVTRLLDRTPSDRPVWIDIQERSPPRPVLAALGEVDQDLAFTVTEDPRREWPGTMCRYQPGRGMHEVDCDASAQAVLTDASLAAQIRDAADPAEVLAWITSVLGLDWRTPAAPDGPAALPRGRPRSAGPPSPDRAPGTRRGDHRPARADPRRRSSRPRGHLPRPDRRRRDLDLARRLLAGHSRADRGLLD